MKEARIKIVKMGQMTYYQPELKQGWWIFKHWVSFHAFSGIGNLNLNRKIHLFTDYDKAMDQFKEYTKLTDKHYRMTHSRCLSGSDDSA